MKRNIAGIISVCMTGMALYVSPVHAVEQSGMADIVNSVTEQVDIADILDSVAGQSGVADILDSVAGQAGVADILDSVAGQAETAEELHVESIKDVVSMPVGTAALLESEKTEEEYMEAAQEAAGALWGYTNLGISNVSDNLNIRKAPSEDGKMVGKLPKNAACELISEEGEWTYIRSGKVEGYVKSEFLLSGWSAKKRALEEVSTVAVVDTTTLKVREQPNTDCEVITMVPRGEELDVVEVMDDWVKIMIDDEENYVSAEYVRLEEKLASAITMTELLYGQGVSNIRVDLCQFAKQYVGNPYVWGGTSLTKGADCSGFVLSVFKNFGVSLPRTSGSQANAGTKISMAEAKPGDLIFYAKGGRINHVAIYIGNGQVVHASSPKTGIKISNYNYRTPAKVVRILPKD